MQRAYTKTLFDFVRGHRHFDRMRGGIATGDILPCLRKDEIDFYEGGARLFRFGVNKVITHRQYIDGHGNGDRALGPDEQTQEVFDRIRNKARTHRVGNVTSELAAVHALFPTFAATRNEHRPGQLALIDVEARFGGDEATELPDGMIDLVFVMPDHRVLFVEAKCMGNPAVASIARAAVDEQVKNYERHIGHPGVPEAIKRSIEAHSILVGRASELATGIFPRVPILLLDPSTPQLAIGPRNSWLTDRLNAAGAWTVNSERPLVIDGRRDPASAIRAFVERFGSPQSA